MTADQDLLDSLIEEFENSSFDEVEIEVDDLRIHLVRDGVESSGGAIRNRDVTAERPWQAQTPEAAAEEETQPTPGSGDAGAPRSPESDEALVTVRAPLSGTFYRSPSPSEPPFVQVGSTVREDDPIGLIEVMKLFNTVKAGVTGTVTAIATENGDLVKESEALVYIQPDA